MGRTSETGRDRDFAGRKRETEGTEGGRGADRKGGRKGGRGREGERE